MSRALLLSPRQSAVRTPSLASTAEILRGPGEAVRMAEPGPLHLLPGGREAVGGTSERAVCAGARA